MSSFPLSPPDNADNFIAALREALPPVFTRKELTRKSGGAINGRTLANLDSLKRGPARVRVMGKTVYEREAFLVWLQARVKPVLESASLSGEG